MAVFLVIIKYIAYLRLLYKLFFIIRSLRQVCNTKIEAVKLA